MAVGAALSTPSSANPLPGMPSEEDLDFYRGSMRVDWESSWKLHLQAKHNVLLK